MSTAELRELEWYLRDHFFREFNRGKNQFKIESLPREMIKVYLRYKNSDIDKMSIMFSSVLERLRSQLVITQSVKNSLELIGGLSRLQCSKCFYICYLSDNEPKKCARCCAEELHTFPRNSLKKK